MVVWSMAVPEPDDEDRARLGLAVSRLRERLAAIAAGQAAGEAMEAG
jgi:hypothetical protein